MKKILSLVMALFLIGSISLIALADTNEDTFDASVFESSSLYSYDRFEKEWKITGWYEREYSDFRFEVGCLLFTTYVDKGWGPELRVIAYDKDTDEYDTVKELYIIVDDTLFSFEKLKTSATNSYCFGGNVSREFLNALKTAKEVLFKISAVDGKYGSTYSTTIESVKLEDLSELIEIADLLEKSNAWSIDSNPEKSDENVKASIS